MIETVDFHGAGFHIAGKVGLMPLMRFAKIAQSGIDANELEGLAAMHDLIEQTLDPADWPRFVQHVTRLRLDGDEIMGFVGEVMTLMAARPTQRSSDSSDGPRTIEPTSTDGSSSVVAQLNSKGRPDLALLVRKRAESLSA